MRGQLDWDRLAAYSPVRLSTEKRRAAVVAPIFHRDGEPHVVFTRRADDLSDHPGQMSFPGGGMEPGDEDLQAAASREADEEIGLRRPETEFVGRLDELETVSAYVVTPFVARVPDRTYQPDDREVARVVPLSVSALVDPTNYEAERREHPRYGQIRLDFFTVGDHTVWGATGRMLAQLLQLTTDWEPPTEVADPD